MWVNLPIPNLHIFLRVLGLLSGLAWFEMMLLFVHKILILDNVCIGLSRKTYSVRRGCLARTGSSSAQMRIKNNIFVVGCTFHVLGC